ncbi:imidazoleglycerol-phosphate dehydratase HisB, partial [Odoribacter laneus]
YRGGEIFTDLPVAFCTESWLEIRDFLKQGCRRVKIERRTSETEVCAELDLNGSGRAGIDTGIAFFDHMLEQLARHGGVDLYFQVKGDLHVDEHHTIEDAAIVLGSAFREALGSKKGIERYGFALPMDESKAEVLLDFGGRACLEWRVAFTREYVGDFPTEMTRHFFASFCESSKCNLHIVAEGENMHHLIEAIFKAFARCIRMAIRQTGTAIPSSKGIL